MVRKCGMHACTYISWTVENADLEIAGQLDKPKVNIRYKNLIVYV